MPLQTGQRNTFNDAIGLKQDISNSLPILVDPYDIPLYMRLASKPPTVQAYKHEWLEESLQPTVVVLAEPIDGSETAWDLVDASGLKAGDVLQVRTTREKVRVSSVAGNTATVARGYSGSTVSAAALTGDNADIIGQAVPDGADPADFVTTNRDPKFNFQQTFQEKIEVTDLDAWTKVYGIWDKFSHEVGKKLKYMAILTEKAMLRGSRFEDPTNKTRQMGGIDFYVTTNAVDELVADIDEDLIRARLQSSYDNGGRVDLTVVGPIQKGKISALISAAQRWYPRPGLNEAVGVSANEFISDFGNVELMMDRNILADEAYYLQTENFSKISGMPFTLENLSKTGTARKSQIVGWASFEVKAEKRSARSFNLKTT